MNCSVKSLPLIRVPEDDILQDSEKDIRLEKVLEEAFESVLLICFCMRLNSM